MGKKPKTRPLDLGALVAVTEITGGTKGAPHVTSPGTAIDADEREKLGLDEGELLRLLGLGAIRQQSGAGAAPGVTAAEPGTFDGIGRDALRSSLKRAGVEVGDDAGIEEMLDAAIGHGAPAEGEAIARADLIATLAEAGVEIGEDASIEDALTAALDHGTTEPFDLDAAANAIERELKADEIRAELEQAEVPFETDANKPALSRLLAQVRHASAPQAANPTLV